MASLNLVKLNAVVFLVMMSQESGEAVTQYLQDNSIATNEASQPSVYSEAPQVYYIPYPKYVSSSNQKYIPHRESQVPISTEKTILSPNYKLTLDTTKYITAQVAKSPQVEYSNQVAYPHLYTLAKAVPSTTTAYTPVAYSPVASAGGKQYEEAPKKYHYGYRVSNPESGAEFGHSEVNDGLSARGYYHVLLPDGRLQSVKYWAGPSGYHATITYESKY